MHRPNRSAAIKAYFFRWDISGICPVTVLKLCVTVFTSLPFRTLWPNWLNFFLSFKKKFGKINPDWSSASIQSPLQIVTGVLHVNDCNEKGGSRIAKPKQFQGGLLSCRASERNFPGGTKTKTGPPSFWDICRNLYSLCVHDCIVIRVQINSYRAKIKKLIFNCYAGNWLTLVILDMNTKDLVFVLSPTRARMHLLQSPLVDPALRPSTESAPKRVSATNRHRSLWWRKLPSLVWSERAVSKFHCGRNWRRPDNVGKATHMLATMLAW